MNKTPFLSKLVGQNSFKKEVSFFLEGFERSGYFPVSLIYAKRGQGKSTVAKALAAELSRITQEKHGEKKGFICINSSEVKNCEVLFTQLLPLITENKYLTLFFEECSELPASVQNSLLQILEPNEKYKSEYFMPNGEKHIFDFTRLTVLMATTNPSALHADLRDRARRFELDQFDDNQLAIIIQKHAPKVKFSSEVLPLITTSLRGNARKCVQRAREISSMNVEDFGVTEYEYLKKMLGILPLGLTKTELRYLQELRNVSTLTLTDLFSRLESTKEQVQFDTEIYLRQAKLIEVKTSGRCLTKRGREILAEIDALAA